MCRWRDVIAGSSAPFQRFEIYLAKINTKYQVLANKTLWLEGLKCYLSLCQVSGTDSVLFTRNL